MSKSDVELMLEFKLTGREEPFAELVGRYKAPLLNFFYRLTWDRQVSEDCCQEVFCRIFRARKKYEPTASFATYLYRIGRNLWVDRYRSLRSAPSPVSLNAEVGEDGHALSALVAAENTDPAHSTEVKDDMARVRQALDRLSPELRETLILVKYQGLKYAEAADTLGVPIGTVRSRIHAALEHLRSALNDTSKHAATEQDDE